jgi:predicted metalloendopeptidase
MYDILFLFQFDQTSLGLPTKDYFLHPFYIIFLQAYKYYLIKISTLLGAPLDEARQQAEELIDFEARLAQVSHHKCIPLFEISDKFSIV